MKKIWKFLYHFFPIQLLFLHFRRSLLLLVFWLLLFAMAGGYMFRDIGIPYLFEMPEYLGDVNFLSYFIMGLILGLFVMSFHMASYIFYSYRFTFLATLSRPLYRFSINNSIIPLVFYGFYSTVIVSVLKEEGMGSGQIALDVFAMLLGSIVSISLSFTYFFSTIRKPEGATQNEIKLPKPLRNLIYKDKKLEEAPEDKNVFTYLKNYYSIRLARPSGHYNDDERLRILQQHHTNAAIYFLALLLVLFVLSIFSDNHFLIIPAGASLVLILTMFLMVFGALFSWLKTWTTTVLLILVFTLNFISGLPKFESRHELAGIDYEQELVPFTYEAMAKLTTDSILDFDEAQMIKALEGWKVRQKTDKPKLIIMNSSGGGMRASLFTFGALQLIDSLSQSKFHDQLFMFAGSSGGMIGAAYYRELAIRREKGLAMGINSRSYYSYLGKDILNPVGFTMVVNDMFFPLRSYRQAGFKYRANRGSAWEKRFNENTKFVLNKHVISYQKLEQNGTIPLMILSPTLINNGQRLFISPVGLSFLCRHRLKHQTRRSDQFDGIEFSRFFKDRQADSITLVSALRMSSTFPYITPYVSLPTSPKIEVIDAGARDNDGFLLTIRFLYVFKDWIAENTGGVVIVQTQAARPLDNEIPENPYNTRLDGLIKPLGSIVHSFATLQGFNRSEMLSYSKEWLDFPLDIIPISLLQQQDEISLSWHLTQREKRYIYQSIRSERLKSNFESVIEKL